MNVFEIDGIRYVWIAPPRTASRSFARVLHNNGIVPQDFRHNHVNLDPDDFDGKVIITVRHPQTRLMSIFQWVHHIETTDHRIIRTDYKQWEPTVPDVFTPEYFIENMKDKYFGYVRSCSSFLNGVDPEVVISSEYFVNCIQKRLPPSINISEEDVPHIRDERIGDWIPEYDYIYNWMRSKEAGPIMHELYWKDMAIFGYDLEEA